MRKNSFIILTVPFFRYVSYNQYHITENCDHDKLNRSGYNLYDCTHS